MSRPFRSTAFRLVLSYAGIGSAVLLLFAAGFWLFSAGRLNRVLADIIAANASAIVQQYDRQGPAATAEAIDQRVGATPARGEVALLVDAAGRRLAGNLPAWPPEVDREPGYYDVSVALPDGGRARARVLVSDLPDGGHLVVGRTISGLLLIRELFFGGLTGAVGVVLALGVIGSALVHRAVLARVEVLNRTTAAIVQGDLRQRLPTRRARDELDLLAVTINGMLDQIETLVQGVRNVSNAIAHDLRTPLAELRTRLEELAHSTPAANPGAAGIDAAVLDVDRVIGIFNALLRLAEIDSGARRSGFTTVDVAAIVRDAAELYEPAAELKGIAVSTDAAHAPIVRGDAVLIAQATSNLIDNAIKYTPRGGAIAVVATRLADGSARITVADSGPGIPVGERARVVERFYRGDASRGTPGVGLGLSLVSAVGSLHGGRLDLEDNGPGLRASLCLPGPAESAV